MIEGSQYFRRFIKDAKKMSPHLIFKPIQYGHYRIYWKNGGEPAYLHECYKWMPYRSYHFEDNDIDLISQKYYEEYEDQIQYTRKIKNFVEGYTDAMDTLRTRLYMLKNNREFRENATKAYRTIRVK